MDEHLLRQVWPEPLHGSVYRPIRQARGMGKENGIPGKEPAGFLSVARLGTLVCIFGMRCTFLSISENERSNVFEESEEDSVGWWRVCMDCDHGSSLLDLWSNILMKNLQYLPEAYSTILSFYYWKWKFRALTPELLMPLV